MAAGDDRIRDGVVSLGRLMARRGLGEVHGVHVHAQGRTEVEHHWTPDVRRDVFSVSKTFLSVAVGFAKADGLLALSDPLLSHLGHLAPVAAEGAESITIEHLLTMTSGIVYRWRIRRSPTEIRLSPSSPRRSGRRPAPPSPIAAATAIC